MICNLFLLLMDGGSIVSISAWQLLHAVGYPLNCPNMVCLIVFPNINQTPKQNYPSQPEKKTIKMTYCKRFDNSCYHHQCIANRTAVILL